MQPDRHASIPPRLLIQWHVTERCNLQCAHCYQESPRPSELPLAGLLDILVRIEEFVAFLRTAAGKPIPVHLTLTGGEPYLHEGFGALVERIAHAPQRRSFAILTNGSLIDAATADALRPLKPSFVQVSLEGDEPTHDRIRGPGTFRQATRALRLLTDRSIPAYISFTAHRENRDEFPAVAALAQSLKVTRLWCDRMIPLGRGRSDLDRLLSPGETHRFFETMRAEQARRSTARTEIAMHRALQFLVAGGEPYRCSAGHTLLTILPDGTLCPCRRMPIPVGNVLDQSLRDLYFDSEILRALREHVPPDSCSKCFYSELCRGGLRCLAQAVHGTPFAPDPGCWLAQPFTCAPDPATPETGRNLSAGTLDPPGAL